MAISFAETITAHCHKCQKDAEWAITHRYVSYWGITHCMRCIRCNTVVPEFAWSEYQKTGRVVIPV